MSNNLPLGTFFQDGIRSGPLYSGPVPSSLLPFNSTEVLNYGAYTAYGPGILYSPQFTWTITPQPAGLANVVAQTPAASILGAGNLTLTQDNAATQLIGGPDGYLQFDWPRIVTVTISGANAGNRRITIFGTDWYGNPLQHTYAVQAQQTYPIIKTGAGGSIKHFIPLREFISMVL